MQSQNDLLPESRMMDNRVVLHVRPDRTLRAKIIDSCGLTCTFCHNEGTPVAADYKISSRNPTRSAVRLSGRSSIYAATNGAGFLPAPMWPDSEFREAIDQMRTALDLNELHLTGGEPTLHPAVPDIVELGTASGYRVCMTSNGENGFNILTDCAAAGLHRINLSIFGTTPEELASVQHARFQNTQLAKRKLASLERTIEAALSLDIGVSANIVVPDESHLVRVHRLMKRYSGQLSIRLLNSLDDGVASIDAIRLLLSDLGARPVAVHLTAGASGYRTEYVLPNGRTIYFKQIRPIHLKPTCSTCQFRDPTTCQEGYYGLRLYRAMDGQYLVGVCIQRMDLCTPVAAFGTSDLAQQVRELREYELRHRDEMLSAIGAVFAPTTLSESKTYRAEMAAPDAED
jgi:GTP 3',8-cyclase